MQIGVLFDVGSCLMDESARLRRALEWSAGALRERGRPVSAKHLREAYRTACRRPDPDESSLLVQMFRALGLFEREAQALRRSLPWDAEPLATYPDTLAALRRLRQAGFRAGVLANQPASTQADLDRAGVTALCDGVWLSGAVGLQKPDPAFFALALSAWGLPADRVAYVGDRPDHDVAPAKALGLTTVRVRRGPHTELEPRGEAEVPAMEVATLAEAATCLLSWGASLSGAG